jgi:hypothetical protein
VLDRPEFVFSFSTNDSVCISAVVLPFTLATEPVLVSMPMACIVSGVATFAS